MRILITGGQGFLGRGLAARARQDGLTVTTVDRHEAADRTCDIGNPTAIASLITQERPDIVVHLAAALTDAAAEDVVAATQVNALGTAAVFSASLTAGVRRTIYASSIAAVGPCAESSGDDVLLSPQSIYGATKAFGEHLARAMSTMGDTQFVSLRFGWIYGPGRVRGWRVAQDVIERFAAGERDVPYPESGLVMDWTYVDDAVEVLMRMLDSPLPHYSVFNVVGDRRRMADAVSHLESRFPGAKGYPVPVISPPSGWGIRNDKLRTVIGYVPQTRLEEGIDRMLSLS